MKRHSILLAALCALLLMVPGESRAASVYKLSMTTLYPTTHPTCANVWLPWIRQINRETNGRVVINYFDPNTICPNNEMYASVVSGAVDIAGHLCGATPGKFPSMEAPALPLLVESALAGSLTVWDFYDREEQAKKDFRDVKILWMWSSADFHIQTISRPVRTLEDIRGLKLICWTQDNAELCKALGGIPINIPTQDTYLALQRGMADGLLTPIASMRSYKTSEVCAYTTMCSLMVNPIWMAMNKTRWNSLPDDIKAVFEKNSGRVMAHASGKSLDDGSMLDYTYLAEKEGKVFYILPAEERARWQEAVRPLHEKWLKKMAGAFDAEQLRKDVLDISSRNAQDAPRRY